jgi:archaellum component FlaF (FlaF/FlaG flagellin family)
VEGLKARRGDLSGPVLAILVTLVLLAIGAAIIAYFVLLGTSPQQAVIAVVGQPTIVKAGTNGFIANVTIKNVGSTNITLSTGNIKLNITGNMLTANFLSRTSLTPGATATIGFSTTSGWGSIAARETASGALIIRDVGTMEVMFRVIKPS